MTFLATRDGQLVDGGQQPWPRPWAFRCDDCGRILPYGSVISTGAARRDVTEARYLGPDRHRCGDCETGQLSAWLA